MFEIVDAIIESDQFTGPTKAVLIALCKHINKERYDASGDTEVWAGYKRLQRFSGYSKRTVQREIVELESNGIITTISEGSGKDSAHYIIHVDKIVVSEGYSQSGYTPVVTEAIPVVTPAMGGSQSGYGGIVRAATKQVTEQGFEPEKKKEEEQTNIVRSSLDLVFNPTNPDEQEKLEFAKFHKAFWFKFTDNPKSFQKGCLESPEFDKQFRKWKKSQKGNGHKTLLTPEYLEEKRLQKEEDDRLAAEEARQETLRLKEQDKRRTCSVCKKIEVYDIPRGFCRDCGHKDPEGKYHPAFIGVENCERCSALRKEKRGMA